VLYSPASTEQLGAAPESTRRALLAQRYRSTVPWIFNILANDIEHRTARPVMDSFPPEVHISLTGRCNIECRFCSYTHDKAYSDYVDVDRIARLDFLPHVHTLRLSSGLGEPTLNPHLPAIIEYVAGHYPQIGLNFFTNGVTLGRRGLIDALIHKTAWINVSLNAATAATWQELCERDLFDRLADGLKELHQAKCARQSSWPVVYSSMVLTSKNLHELPRMPALCRSLGVDRFTAIPFFGYAYAIPGKYAAAESFHRCRGDYEAVYAETVREAKAHGVSVELPLPQSRAAYGVELRSFYDFADIEGTPRWLGRLVEHLDYQQRGAEPCFDLWRIAHIGSTNRAHASTTATHYLYPCLGPLVTADLSTQTAFDFHDSRGFLEIWNNPVFVRLRTAQRQRGLSPVCDVCRAMDSRDPDNFATLDGVLAEWRDVPPLIPAEELTLRRR
jgi:MoaA/NifB/PqqE/SkfB family radical SAM enzyme